MKTILFAIGFLLLTGCCDPVTQTVHTNYCVKYADMVCESKTAGMSFEAKCVSKCLKYEQKDIYLTSCQ